MSEFRHCDEYIKDKTQPKCLRKFLLYKRIPAYWQYRLWKKSWGTPALFARVNTVNLTKKQIYDLEQSLCADERGKVNEGLKVNLLLTGYKVRVVMASRFGDVGITTNLSASNGYSLRVPVEWLNDFSEAP